MKKKVVCAILAATMLMSVTPVLAEEASGEVVTLTFSAQNDTGTDWNETLVFQEYEKRLGIKLDTTTYSSEQWTSKYTLMLTGDELPDLVRPNVSYTEFQKQAKDGYFLDFSQYLDQMPNLQAIMEEYPEYAKTITSEDGSIYGFPQLQTFPPNTKDSYYVFNNSWLKNLGLEKPKTLDELYNVLKAFKEQDANGNGDPNDEIPMGMGNTATNASVNDVERPIMWAFGMNTRDSGYALKADENNQVGIWNTTENYKDFLKYMNKLYSEELINQDAYSLDSSALQEMAKENKVGFVGTIGSILPALQEDKEFYYMPLGFIQEGYTDHSSSTISRTGGAGNVLLAANAETENPEAVVKFVDYMFSVEGSISTGNGYEGITFAYNDICGQQVIDHNEFWTAAGYESQEAYRNAVLALNATRIFISPYGSIYNLLDNVETDQLLSDEVWAVCTVNALRELAFRDETVEVHLQFPGLIYTDEEATERSSLYSDINNYINTSKAQFITGEMDIDASWDAYIEKLNQMGLERILEIDQAAYDRYIG